MVITYLKCKFLSSSGNLNRKKSSINIETDQLLPFPNEDYRINIYYLLNISAFI